MSFYSPIGEEFTLEKLARFMQDVWTKVDESGQFDPTDWTLQQLLLLFSTRGLVGMLS